MLPGATPQCERRPFTRVLKVREKGGHSAWYVVGKRLPKDAEGPKLVSQSVCHHPDMGTLRRGNGKTPRWTREGCKMRWERRLVSTFERTGDPISEEYVTFGKFAGYAMGARSTGRGWHVLRSTR